MKTIALITWCVLAFTAFATAQNGRVTEKQKRTNDFIAISREYDAKAKEGTLTNAELNSLTQLFNQTDNYLGSYITGEEGQLIFNKLYRLRCYTMYTNILMRIKHNDEVIAIARKQYKLPDDGLIVDAETVKAAHQYDYGNRTNDKYDKLQTGGFIMQRKDFVTIAGNFYSSLILACSLTKNYTLMDSLFQKGIKYGYYENLPAILRNTIGKNVLSTYNTPADYAPKYMQAVTLVKDAFDGLTEEQKQKETENTKVNKKINELFATALKQDVTKAEGIIAFNTALKYMLKDKAMSDADKANLIKANLDAWIIQADNANKQWLSDKTIYAGVGSSITQELLKPEDKAFSDKFCAFINSHGFYASETNPRLVYDCYLYYKNNGQKKEAKRFYKEHLKTRYSEQFPD